MEDYRQIQLIADQDVAVLKVKGETYGRSWMKRGGVGAMMMLARKWDRIEEIVSKRKWDILSAGADNDGDIMDDIADLRRYLLLVESEVHTLRAQYGGEPGLEYVDPDRGGGTG